MLEAASKRAVRAVVAFKLDRLFRNAGDCLTVVEGWERRGVALHLIDLGGQAIDTSSAAGKFFLTVMAGAAEMERNQIRERTRAGMAEKRARCEYTGGQVPYGYVVGAGGRELVEQPDEQEIVATIRELRAEGTSLRGIVERLNADEVPARGSRWHLKAVAAIARRESIHSS